MDLKSLVGKKIKDIRVYRYSQYSSGSDILVIETKDGEMLKIGIGFTHCDDCWLEWEDKNGTQFHLDENLRQA